MSLIHRLFFFDLIENVFYVYFFWRLLLTRVAEFDVKNYLGACTQGVFCGKVRVERSSKAFKRVFIGFFLKFIATVLTSKINFLSFLIIFDQSTPPHSESFVSFVSFVYHNKYKCTRVYTCTRAFLIVYMQECAFTTPHPKNRLFPKNAYFC